MLQAATDCGGLEAPGQAPLAAGLVALATSPDRLASVLVLEPTGEWLGPHAVEAEAEASSAGGEGGEGGGWREWVRGLVSRWRPAREGASGGAYGAHSLSPLRVGSVFPTLVGVGTVGDGALPPGGLEPSRQLLVAAVL